MTAKDAVRAREAQRRRPVKVKAPVIEEPKAKVSRRKTEPEPEIEVQPVEVPEAEWQL